MKKLLLSLAAFAAVAATTPMLFVAPNTQYLSVGSHSSLTATMQNTVVTNVDGYMFDVSDNTYVRWSIPPTSITGTQCVISFTQFATNMNLYAYEFSMSLHTTNRVPVYSTNLTLSGGLISGPFTNFFSFVQTNAIPPSILTTGIVYGTVSLKHGTVVGVPGRVWITGGSLKFRNGTNWNQ